MKIKSQPMFQFQEEFLPLQASGIACKGAVGTNDTVARDNETDGIASHGTANSLCGHVFFGERCAF